MKNLLAVIFVFLIYGCRERYLDEQGLNKYLLDESHGTMKQIEEDGFHLSLTYRPSEFIARQQTVTGTEEEFDSLRTYFDRYYYFLLDMTYQGKDLETSLALNPSRFAQNISYLSDKFSEDVRLITAKDTARVVDFVYARSYGIGSSQFLLAFDKPGQDKFEIQLKGYPLGLSKKAFLFDKGDLNKTPHLKIN